MFLSVLACLLSLVITLAFGAIPWDVKQNGDFTYYTAGGYGACGTTINADTQMLVAVSAEWWTSANPNKDPLCTGVCVKVTFNGKTVTVPVKDKCVGCKKGHLDLSRPAFEKLAPLSVGHAYGAVWAFVHC